MGLCIDSENYFDCHSTEQELKVFGHGSTFLDCLAVGFDGLCSFLLKFIQIAFLDTFNLFCPDLLFFLKPAFGVLPGRLQTPVVHLVDPILVDNVPIFHTVDVVFNFISAVVDGPLSS